MNVKDMQNDAAQFFWFAQQLAKKKATFGRQPLMCCVCFTLVFQVLAPEFLQLLRRFEELLRPLLFLQQARQLQ